MRGTMRHIAGTDIADLLAPGPGTVQGAALGTAPGAASATRLARKAVLVLGADGCEPLRSRVIIGVLQELAREVVVVAGSRAHVQGLESARVSVVDFDCGPCWRNPL